MRSPVCAMASQSASIIPLCQCFRGLPPKRGDWLSLIELANRTLTTPALMDFVDRFPGHVPQDARRYVTEICRRNVIRNDRLAAQLIEAVAALNEKGVTPVLLKGTALLAAKDHVNLFLYDVRQSEDHKPIDWVKAEYRSIRGPIASEWKMDEGVLKISSSVPVEMPRSSARGSASTDAASLTSVRTPSTRSFSS